LVITNAYLTERSKQMENRFSTGALLSALILAGIVCLWIIAKGGTTQTESLLLGLVLTILSILGSWIASRFYAERSFNKNLRIFALKASEKVTNLSNELDRLSAFLQQELEAGDYESHSQVLLAKNSRIEAAVHIINTLKSVNDRSLSDWQGVIGDELMQQRRAQEEREEELKELIDRLESLSSGDADQETAEEDENTAILRTEIASLKGDVRVLASQVSGIPIRRPKALQARQDIDGKCPKCFHPIQYRQRPKSNSFKSVICVNCGANLYSHYSEEGFVLSSRSPVPEEVICPNCLQSLMVNLDPMPGSKLEWDCESCGVPVRAFRTAKRINMKKVDVANAATSEEPELDERIIERVRESMPPQPWPTGAAKQVASELGLSTKIVSGAIHKLVDCGVFKLQVDGQLYAREPLVDQSS
jgi:protein-arginine kinase activator protein McsA